MKENDYDGWTCKENARKQTTATENFRMGTRGNAKKGKTQREMDRWSKTDHDKPWTEKRILETETDGET
jgi:hypothetical protein